MQRKILNIGGILVLMIAFVNCQPHKKYQTQAEKSVQDGVDLQQVTTAKNKGFISQQNRVLSQANQIFAESWYVLFGRASTAPTSVFKAINNRLNLHVRNEEFVELSGSCPTNHTRLDLVKDYSGRVTELKLIAVDCAANIKTEVFLIKYLSPTLVNISVNSNQVSDGVGESLALLNKRVVCDLSIDNLDRIGMMRCSGLGQNLERTVHVEFRKMLYQRTTQQVLEVQADRFQNLTEKMGCDLSGPCLQLRVPYTGTLEVVDNQMRKVLKEEKPSVNLTPVGVVNASKEENIGFESIDIRQPENRR